MGESNDAGQKPWLETGLSWRARFWLRFLSGVSDQPTSTVEPTDSVGPRTLEKQTETAVVRDYLQAWHSLSGALEQNRVDLLDADFVGTAKEKLSDTIQEQAKLGIQTRYRRQSARCATGLLLAGRTIDSTSGYGDYDVQLIDHEKPQITQHVRARYVAVLTPTEVRWKVRVFQAEPE